MVDAPFLKETTPIYYIAMPYSINPSASVKMSAVIAANLARENKLYISPILNTHYTEQVLEKIRPGDGAHRYEFYLKLDLSIIAQMQNLRMLFCDLYAPNGRMLHQRWYDSSGCRKEYLFARSRFITCEYYSIMRVNRRFEEIPFQFEVKKDD
jgi:hypothetical protein